MILAILLAAAVNASPSPAASAPVAAPSPTATSGAPTGSQPPDGTYTYQGMIGSQPILQSTVVVKHNAGGVDVKEMETASGMQGTATTTADMQLSPDLRPTKYDAVYGLPGGAKVSAAVTFSGNAASEQAKGQTIPFNLAPSTTRFAVLDGALQSGALLLPAQMYGQSAVTVVVPVAGLATPLTKANDNPARPAKLGAAEAHLSIGGPVAFVEWYDPATYIVDEVDVPAQNLIITLQRHTSSTSSPAPSAPLPHSTPVSLGPSHFTNSEVHFTSADGTKLAGTLSLPAGRTQAAGVLMLVGSGPVDRDERIGPNLIFAQIAHALGNAGYAVLRYDKRGIGESSGNANLGTRDKLLADARSAIQFFRSRAGVDTSKIFVLGHSEGAMLAIELGGEKELALRGIVLLGAPALPLDQILNKQALHAPPRLIAYIRKSAWYKSYLGRDPAKEIQLVRVPVLILQGGRDQNVLATDTPRLVHAAKAKNRDVSALYFGADSHEFVAGNELTPQYVDPAMLSALIRWLHSHGQAS